MVLIPEGDNKQAWRKFLDALQDKYEGPNFKGISSGPQASTSANGGLIYETHRGTTAAEGGHPIRPLQRGNNVTACDWEPALVIFRSSRYAAWDEIEERLTLSLNRPTTLKSIGEDRAILFCSSRAKRMRIIHRLDSIGGDLVASATQWKLELHWEDRKWGGVNCWISIVGLPLSLWNTEAFAMIGDRFGGLLEVDAQTRRRQNFESAIIKVKGRIKGFYPSELTIPCPNGTAKLFISRTPEVVHLKASGVVNLSNQQNVEVRRMDRPAELAADAPTLRCLPTMVDLAARKDSQLAPPMITTSLVGVMENTIPSSPNLQLAEPLMQHQPPSGLGQAPVTLTEKTVPVRPYTLPVEPMREHLSVPELGQGPQSPVAIPITPASSRVVGDRGRSSCHAHMVSIRECHTWEYSLVLGMMMGTRVLSMLLLQ
ncbi:hypothetical protein Syun_030229 [Stephania yunnanensis]|uniref:DUF4283 domain-containing protein n=1 Tax=Stephania yunnanensis TaxID=152371 RepID=A0AAP0E6X5_9MAGN